MTCPRWRTSNTPLVNTSGRVHGRLSTSEVEIILRVRDSGTLGIKPIHVRAYSGSDVGELPVATSGAQPRQVSLCTTLVLTDQRLRKGDVLNDILRNHLRERQQWLAPYRPTGVHGRVCYVIEWSCQAGAEIEDATAIRVLEEPQIHFHHIVYKDKIPGMLARAVAAVLAKQLDFTCIAVLVEVVKCHRSHVTFILFPRAVD